MNEQTIRNVPFLRSNLISLPHGMFAAKGGVSRERFKSLNVSFHVGDDPHLVAENRTSIKEILGIEILISARQVHSNIVKLVTSDHDNLEIDACDALITNTPGIGLMIQQADCQAILIHDPFRQAIAAIHCGWRGNCLDIIDRTISMMKDAFSTDPTTLRCAISPSLGPCCAEFINYRNELPQSFQAYQVKPKYFDFWAISRHQLTKAGVPDASIDTAQECTACNQAYFSYRRVKGLVTGRHCSVIALPGGENDHR